MCPAEAFVTARIDFRHGIFDGAFDETELGNIVAIALMAVCCAVLSSFYWVHRVRWPMAVCVGAGAASPSPGDGSGPGRLALLLCGNFGVILINTAWAGTMEALDVLDRASRDPAASVRTRARRVRKEAGYGPGD